MKSRIARVVNKSALLGTLICLYSLNLAGQSSKSSSATVSYSLGQLCSQIGQDPTAVCPEVDWTVTDSTGALDYTGYGSSYGHDDYGALKVGATAVVQTYGPSAVNAAVTRAEG